MSIMKYNRIKWATAGILAASALLPALASASLVNGNVTLTIDNSAFAGANPTPFYVAQHIGSSLNQSSVTATGPTGAGVTTISSTNTAANLAFPVNNNSTTTIYGGDDNNTATTGDNRSLQATTMDSSNTSSGQIGLSGALRLLTNSNSTYLTAIDFSLQKVGGTWNVISHDNGFGSPTLFQLTNSSESLVNGNLSLSGDLIFGSGTLWGTLLQVPANSQNTVVGHLSLTPSAVPVPAAVWLFGSAMAGLVGYRRKSSSLAA